PDASTSTAAAVGACATLSPCQKNTEHSTATAATFKPRCLKTICDDGHELRSRAHERADRPGQLDRARFARRCAVTCFVVAHGRDDRPASRVGPRQPDHVPGQMLLDLALGFDYKAQVRAVAGVA